MAKSWAEYSDKVLADLAADGHTPTAREIRDAYPFGERKYWPYKAWLARVKAWKGAWAAGMRSPAAMQRAVLPRRPAERTDRETGDLFT